MKTERVRHGGVVGKGGKAEETLGNKMVERAEITGMGGSSSPLRSH